LDTKVFPSSLSGSLSLPPSKSHTLRAILLASLAHGVSTINQFLVSPDTHAMIHAVSLLGAKITLSGNRLEIVGTAGTLKPARDMIDCGNSGQVLRFVGAIAGLIPSYTILTGDRSIKQNRVVLPLLQGLNQLGALALSLPGNDRPPLLIKGPLTGKSARIQGEDSQPVSAFLMAAALRKEPTELHVTNPGEKPWVDLTLSWLERLGLAYEREGYSVYRLPGNGKIKAFTCTIPGDWSSAAFPLIAGLITNSTLTLYNADLQDPQGDKKIVQILRERGAAFSYDEKSQSLTLHKGAELKGGRMDLNDCIDALPALATLACFCKGRTEIVGSAISRKKESDRIAAMAQELKKMGGCIEETEEGLIIEKSPLHGATLSSHSDHRVALALFTGALGASSPSEITGTECIDKSYPDFCIDLRKVGAKIE